MEEGVAYHYQTRVRGKIITFNRDAINTYLGHPLTLAGNMRCEYRAKETANDWDLAARENLNLEARAYLVLLLNNIRPRSHRTTIPLDVSCLLYYIMIGKSVDVASIIAHEMRKVATSGTKFGGKTDVLMYPGLIMGLCRRANVPIPDEVHLSIASVINDAFLNRFYQSQIDRAEGAGTSSSRPRARGAPVFDQMAFATYCCENFEASRRSQLFLFDAMQQQFQNTLLAPEARTFLTQAEYVSYSNWPEGRPTFMGGAGDSGQASGAGHDEDMEDVIGSVGGGIDEED
ncbi:hypothetical protein KIW84_066245 [Lathyrus oleraceus]|uniref:Putative plant transposon protein domain-containing protein n=1 Tax=Pisum sativum TaxID=3888 RepID=A0A9D4WHP8_PEA|nr:hypothetical protein KIW84_066245 [Pisum sativum]